MLDFNDEFDDDDYGELGRRVYRNLQMEEQMRTAPNPDILLGFKKALASTCLEDRCLTDADKLSCFLENNPLIAGSGELNRGICLSYCMEYTAEE